MCTDPNVFILIIDQVDRGFDVTLLNEKDIAMGPVQYDSGFAVGDDGCFHHTRRWRRGCACG